MGLAGQCGKLAEFKKNIGKHVSLFSGHAFSQMQSMPGKSLQCQILGSTPRAILDPTDTGEISDDKCIDKIVFSDVDE